MRIRPELIARHYIPDAALPAAAAPAESVKDTVKELTEAFNLFDEWHDRYQYIIDLGKKLPVMPSQYCTEEHRLHGCQSTVWLVMTQQAGRLYVHANSDALIVSGLIALITSVYSGRTPSEILGQDVSFVNGLGLGDHLSQGRKNGLFAMVEAIHTVAAHAQRQQEAA